MVVCEPIHFHQKQAKTTMGNNKVLAYISTMLILASISFVQVWSNVVTVKLKDTSQKETKMKGDTSRQQNYDFWNMSYPLVLEGSSSKIQRDPKSWWLQHTGLFCQTDLVCQEGEKLVGRLGSVQQLEEEVVIAMHWPDDYFHSLFETATQLESLSIHGVFENYPNSTLLWFGAVPSGPSRQMLDLLGFGKILSHIQFAKDAPVWYQLKNPDGKFVLPIFHGYHEKQEPYLSYKFWLLESMRSRVLPSLSMPSVQKRFLFISGKGCRRGIIQEDHLFRTLKQKIPPLERVIPDEYSVREQAQMFASASLIISPHGAFLVNLVFADWTTAVVIEITPEELPTTYGVDVKIRQHYVFTCPSETGDLWDRHMDCNVTQVVKSVLEIWKNDALPAVAPTAGDVETIRVISSS